MIFTCPSKTFICGEYGVLAGGRALILTHEPRFSLKITPLKDKSGQLPPWIHPRSPAGKFYEKNKKIFSGFDFQFTDPHQGRGGFGASGAQFLTLYAFDHQRKDQSISADSLYKDFKSLDDSGSSGCDVLSQWIGGIAQVDMSDPQGVCVANWPFEDFEVLVVSTGIKLTTHDHLKEVDRSALDDLKKASQKVGEFFERGDGSGFLESLRAFASLMEEKGLVASHSLGLLKNLREEPGVLLAKACGAMGADTLLVLLEKGETSAFKETLNSMNLLWFEALKHKNSGLVVEI